MNHVLKSKSYSAEINSEGAELTSFRNLETGCEYLWTGDKNFWADHSPVLFPIVCAANNGEIRVDGKVYKIGNHGFARKIDFETVEAAETRAVYRLKSSGETLSMYPFHFELFLTYMLRENRLKVEYKVVNADNKTIYFQIGTHPGFNCPIGNEGRFEDYYLEFEHEENLERFFMNGANVVINGKSEKMALQKGRILPLTHSLFQDGALVFKKLKSKKIALKSGKTGKNVVLSYEGLPALGLWQAKNAPFICIEPWHGLADADGYTGEFKDKDMIIALEKGESFQCFHQIEVN
jgi:galactose mutarotase-like enzyme